MPALLASNSAGFAVGMKAAGMRRRASPSGVARACSECDSTSFQTFGKAIGAFRFTTSIGELFSTIWPICSAHNESCSCPIFPPKRSFSKIFELPLESDCELYQKMDGNNYPLTHRTRQCSSALTVSGSALSWELALNRVNTGIMRNLLSSKKSISNR